MRPAEGGEGKQAYVQQRWREGVRRKAGSALEKQPLHASQSWHYWVESSDSAGPSTHLQTFSWSSADQWTYSNYGKEKPQRHSRDQITVLCLSLTQLSLCSDSSSVPKTIPMLWSCLTSLMPFPALSSGQKNNSPHGSRLPLTLRIETTFTFLCLHIPWHLFNSSSFHL